MSPVTLYLWNYFYSTMLMNLLLSSEVSLSTYMCMENRHAVLLGKFHVHGFIVKTKNYGRFIGMVKNFTVDVLLVTDVPARVKEAIQDVELCLHKARTYQHSDGVVSSLLFGHAAGELLLVHTQLCLFVYFLKLIITETM